eukprot:GILJ01005884.1.p1 GENE.GILJ01005884.1~~GILJ01005884.1.p1  ORF type:complete len:899 (+),score=186.87 GILJ01005884.1:112-2808(+)
MPKLETVSSKRAVRPVPVPKRSEKENKPSSVSRVKQNQDIAVVSNVPESIKNLIRRGAEGVGEKVVVVRAARPVHVEQQFVEGLDAPAWAPQDLRGGFTPDPVQPQHHAQELPTFQPAATPVKANSFAHDLEMQIQLKRARELEEKRLLQERERQELAAYSNGDFFWNRRKGGGGDPIRDPATGSVLGNLKMAQSPSSSYTVQHPHSAPPERRSFTKQDTPIHKDDAFVPAAATPVNNGRLQEGFVSEKQKKDAERQAYLRDLEQQILEKKARKEEEERLQRLRDLREEEKAANYSAVLQSRKAQGGGGDVLRDGNGQIVKNLKAHMRERSAMGYEPAPVHPPQEEPDRWAHRSNSDFKNRPVNQVNDEQPPMTAAGSVASRGNSFAQFNSQFTPQFTPQHRDISTAAAAGSEGVATPNGHGRFRFDRCTVDERDGIVRKKAEQAAMREMLREQMEVRQKAKEEETRRRKEDELREQIRIEQDLRRMRDEHEAESSKSQFKASNKSPQTPRETPNGNATVYSRRSAAVDQDRTAPPKRNGLNVHIPHEPIENEETEEESIFNLRSPNEQAVSDDGVNRRPSSRSDQALDELTSLCKQLLSEQQELKAQIARQQNMVAQLQSPNVPSTASVRQRGHLRSQSSNVRPVAKPLRANSDKSVVKVDLQRKAVQEKELAQIKALEDKIQQARNRSLAQKAEKRSTNPPPIQNPIHKESSNDLSPIATFAKGKVGSIIGSSRPPSSSRIPIPGSQSSRNGQQRFPAHSPANRRQIIQKSIFEESTGLGPSLDSQGDSKFIYDLDSGSLFDSSIKVTASFPESDRDQLDRFLMAQLRQQTPRGSGSATPRNGSVTPRLGLVPDSMLLGKGSHMLSPGPSPKIVKNNSKFPKDIFDVPKSGRPTQI